METSLRLPASTSIVFDTNVLISTFVFPGFAADVYDYCILHFEIYTSEWILNEFDRKLETKFGYLPERRLRLLEIIRERHTILSPTNELPTNSIDPDDNYVLQASLFVDASFLITGNKKHLLPLKKINNTEIISPPDFYKQFIQ